MTVIRNALTERSRVQLGDFEETRTKQSFRDSCDINMIMKRYQTTGVVEHVSKYGAQYGVEDGRTFTENMQQIARAQNMFNELPASARKFFDHDPAKFLDYVSDLDDPDKLAQAARMGLLEPDAARDALAPRPQEEPQEEPQADPQALE